MKESFASTVLEPPRWRDVEGKVDEEEIPL
jgi:hypothetical protein